MAKILMVEDDEKLRNELNIFLNSNGYESCYLKSFENPIEDILRESADLILLDINLPNLDGEYICKEIRKMSNVPIIMVTSRDNEIDELLSSLDDNKLETSYPTEDFDEEFIPLDLPDIPGDNPIQPGDIEKSVNLPR